MKNITIKQLLNVLAIPLTIITVHGLEVTGIQIFKIINIEI